MIEVLSKGNPSIFQAWNGIEGAGGDDELDLVRPLGHVSIVGENATASIRPSDHFNRKELHLSGSTCFPLGEYEDITRLFRQGLRARELVTHRFPLAAGAEAYRTFASGQSGKVILLPQS